MVFTDSLKKQLFFKAGVFAAFVLMLMVSCNSPQKTGKSQRERISLDKGWRFMKYNSAAEADSLIYDIRPSMTVYNDSRDADTKPTESVKTEASQKVLKPWILPTGNAFIKNPANRHVRPDSNPGSDFPVVQYDFNDSAWQEVNLPHDWAIKGPFLQGWNAEVGGGMGRLESNGVAWYRRKLDIPKSDSNKLVFLDVDGAMSYAMVWLNGKLAGGWPYGYNSWRLNLTPYINIGGVNQLAIRIDNPPVSSRWYPGGGIYRNVWLTKTSKVHVGHWGTYLTTHDVSEKNATIDLKVTIDNASGANKKVKVVTDIILPGNYDETNKAVASVPEQVIDVPSNSAIVVGGSVELKDPLLWGPPPTQKPNLYKAVTRLYVDGKLMDQYETRFGIRTVKFDPDKGLIVNGEQIKIQGVNQHHDLGALGAAFNKRAAERQLEMLRDMGCNAIRLAHNPPAPELLELTDSMGFLVVDEIFDVWKRKKTPLDFHLIFPDWYEPDLRAFIRRDRNSPSVIMWSFGNEVGEQYTGEQGAELGRKLYEIVKEEDPTRPATASMNFARPDMPFPIIMDVISLNYQGEGIRNAPAYAHLKGITTPPLYPSFHKTFPDKMIVSSETASALSSRGTYLFPVFEGISAPVVDGQGGNPEKMYVSAYELYTAPFGSSADKVFASQDKHPYVAGEFVWSGWDYLGEPTPYYLARSSYSGIIDLAGFKKDRFYLYQSRWRPDLPMVHILPHWNWPERVGKITPVHVFTSGDEAELYLNGKSQGRKKKGPYEYRLRWDSVIYQPGELKAVAYKNGKQWAEETLKTTGRPAKLAATADRKQIDADGRDLSFVTVKVMDENGLVVPDANNLIKFSLQGPGEIVATDNGYPYDMTAFGSHERKAFEGNAIVIVRPVDGEEGIITVIAKSDNLQNDSVKINANL